MHKGFNVWSVEFPELKERLDDAQTKWTEAEKYPNFHKVTFPKDFMTLKEKFDFILLINVVNVMPIPMERFALLTLCRDKIKDDGMLLWHNWRGESIGGKEKYSDENAFIDGYLMQGPNHTFYVEFDRDETHKLLFSTGFSFDASMNLSKIPSNTCYSHIFRPMHEALIPNALNLDQMISTKHDPKPPIPTPKEYLVLRLYINELKHVPFGSKNHAVLNDLFLFGWLS